MQVVAVPVLREKRKKDKKATEKSPFVQARKNTFYHLILSFPRKIKPRHRGTCPGCHGGELAVEELPGIVSFHSMTMLSADGCREEGSTRRLLQWRRLQRCSGAGAADSVLSCDLLELRCSRFACLGPAVQCRHNGRLESSILHVALISLAREEELKQDPDTVPGVHKGASAACALIPLQEIQRQIISGSLCSVLPW